METNGDIDIWRLMEILTYGDQWRLLTYETNGDIDIWRLMEILTYGD